METQQVNPGLGLRSPKKRSWLALLVFCWAVSGPTAYAQESLETASELQDLEMAQQGANLFGLALDATSPQYLAFSNSESGTELAVFDFTGTPLYKVPATLTAPFGAIFLRNGKDLLATFNSSSITVWQRDQPLSSFSHTKDISKIAQRSDGSLVAMTSGGELCVWSMDGTPLVERQLQTNDRFDAAYFEFSPDARFAVWVDKDNLFHHWSIGDSNSTCREIFTEKKTTGNKYYRIKFSVKGDSYWYWEIRTPILYKRDLEGNEISQLRFDPPYRLSTRTLFQIEFFEDRNLFVNDDSDGNLLFWNLTTGELVKSMDNRRMNFRSDPVSSKVLLYGRQR